MDFDLAIVHEEKNLSSYKIFLNMSFNVHLF